MWVLQSLAQRDFQTDMEKEVYTSWQLCQNVYVTIYLNIGQRIALYIFQ